jgi:hypothetical protein
MAAMRPIAASEHRRGVEVVDLRALRRKEVFGGEIS